MAGLGFKTFVAGEVLTAADTNGYLMQGVLVFANASARTAAITAPTEGMFSYLKDTNSTEYYDGSAWVSGVEGDISGVTAGTGISGGGTSGTVTVTNSMATTITTKGDLVPGTGSGTFARLAAGNNGESLVADSSATTGLRYTAGTVQSNPVLNSAMSVWQRGTSISLAASSGLTYLADRYQTQTNANQASTVSRQVTGDTTNLPFIQYAMRYQRNSGQTGTSRQYLINSFETINTIPFVGKTVTLSYYARAGANYSPTSSILEASIFTGTGTDQSAFSYTGSAQIGATNATLTTTWQRFSLTVAIPITVTELAPTFSWVPVGTAGTNDYYELTGVQIDIGSVALPFRTYAATIQGESAACQRYYFRTTPGATNGVITSNAYAFSATVAVGVTSFPVTMRVAPTSIDSSAVQFVIYSDTAFAMSSVTLNSITTNQIGSVYGTVTAATAGQVGRVSASSSSGYLGFSAEL